MSDNYFKYSKEESMKKRILIVVFLCALLFILEACSGSGMRIQQHNVLVDNLVIAYRPGFILAENMYSVQETEQGYDIVVHLVKENND